MSDKSYNAKICPVCGDDRFEWGIAHSYRGSIERLHLLFRRNDAKWNEASEMIHSRKCVNCGNIQLFSRNSLVVLSQKTEKRKRKNDER